MNNKEWLGQLSQLTGLPYYEEHKVFGDKSGALIGVSDGYAVALGLGKDGRNSAVKTLLRYAKTEDPGQIRDALDKAKGKFKKVTADETSAVLIQTYSFGKPDAADVAERFRQLLTALKTFALPIAGKCEECGRTEPQMLLLNDLPAYYCSSCQVQLSQKLDAAAVEYESRESNLFLGLLYGLGAALLGSIAWGGVAYLLNRIFLWGAIIIGMFVGKAVVQGIGKVNWTARGIIGVLTAASVAFGDVIFYTLIVMRRDQAAFVPAFKAVLADFWKIETSADGGLVSILFGLIGAGLVMYRTRMPAFKARFVPLGTPASTLSSVATK